MSIKLVMKLSSSRVSCRTDRVPCSAFFFITEILLQVAVKAHGLYLTLLMVSSLPVLKISFLNDVFVHCISLNCCSVLNSLQYTTCFLFDSAIEFDCIFSDEIIFLT